MMSKRVKKSETDEEKAILFTEWWNTVIKEKFDKEYPADE